MTWSMENLKTIKDVSIMEHPVLEYSNCSIHNALERADTNKDWRVFKYLLSLDRESLLYHFKMSEPAFHYNVYKLPKAEQDKIFL